MTTQQLTTQFCSNHQAFAAYIHSLPEHEFTYSHNGKWTAGQQLSHLCLCLQPISQALASKEYIAQKFGKITRPVLDYDTIVSNYKTGLQHGGKAPERFVPGLFDTNDKGKAAATLEALLQTIRQQLGTYTDEELDTLVLPHPILGNLTIREMMYLMTYHATHHHKQTEENLKGYGIN